MVKVSHGELDVKVWYRCHMRSWMVKVSHGELDVKVW